MSPRNQFMIIGAGVGALLGAVAAYLYVESQVPGGVTTTGKEPGRQLRVKAGVTDYLKIGSAVYTLVRELQKLVKTSEH